MLRLTPDDLLFLLAMKNPDHRARRPLACPSCPSAWCIWPPASRNRNRSSRIDLEDGSLIPGSCQSSGFFPSAVIMVQPAASPRPASTEVCATRQRHITLLVSAFLDLPSGLVLGGRSLELRLALCTTQSAAAPGWSNHTPRVAFGDRAPSVLVISSDPNSSQ